MVAKATFNPVILFDESVPDGFLYDVGRCVYEAYRLAVEECNRNHPSTEWRDVIPHIRNAHLNRLLRELKARYAGAEATSEFNAAHNCRHTEVAVGDIVLTASSVDNYADLPRQADFRETLARDPQHRLFDDDSGDRMPPSATAKLYCILTHCPAADQKLPISVRVVFPNSTCTASMGHIDVLFRYPNLVSTRTEVAAEVVTPVEPQLKKASERA